jgi:hypothetical protein
MSEIFAAFAEHMPPDLAIAGPEDLDRHGSPPLITWEPLSTTHTKVATGVSGGPEDEGILWQREITFRVKLWGTSLAEVEGFLDSFVNAVDRVLGGPWYRLVSETWNAGGPDVSSPHCELAIALKLPLRRQMRPTRLITNVTTTFELETEV